MTDLATAAINIIAEGLSRRYAGQAPIAAAESLFRAVRDRLPGEPSVPQLADEVHSGGPRELTMQRASLAVQDALTADPAFAGLVQGLVQRAEAQGADSERPTFHNDQSLTQKNIRAGRNVINKQVGSRNTRIAVGGGGALLAIALIFVWQQYSTGKKSSDELATYRQSVIAACDRIRTTGTGQLNPVVNADGIFLRRDEVLQLLTRNRTVVKEQTRAALTRPAPKSLAEAHSAAARAAADVELTYSDALAAVRKLPRTVSVERFQSFAAEPAMTDLSNDYRRLGDALTGLAGSSCAIELPSTAK